MTPLCELALKYGTDKYPWYTLFYEALLRDRRNSIARVLEIGIGTPEAMAHVPGYRPGASLRMWRDYFPNAEIFGVDIDERALFSEDRIKTVWGSQDQVQSVGGVDLVIDDASHCPEDQINSASVLFPQLKPGSLYIIEDINNRLDLPFSHQYVECNVAGSDKIGRCIVIPR
jgi:hypothetical protein